MGNNRNLQLAIRLALVTAGVAGGVPVAFSQTVGLRHASGRLGRSCRHRSRLSVPNETSISPITSVSAATIESTGLTRVEDILNNLPMVFAGQNATSSNGGRRHGDHRPARAGPAAHPGSGERPAFGTPASATAAITRTSIRFRRHSFSGSTFSRAVPRPCTVPTRCGRRQLHPRHPFRGCEDRRRRQLLPAPSAQSVRSLGD